MRRNLDCMFRIWNSGGFLSGWGVGKFVHIAMTMNEECYLQIRENNLPDPATNDHNFAHCSPARVRVNWVYVPFSKMEIPNVKQRSSPIDNKGTKTSRSWIRICSQRTLIQLRICHLSRNIVSKFASSNKKTPMNFLGNILDEIMKSEITKNNCVFGCTSK